MIAFFSLWSSKCCFAREWLWLSVRCFHKNELNKKLGRFSCIATRRENINFTLFILFIVLFGFRVIVSCTTWNAPGKHSNNHLAKTETWLLAQLNGFVQVEVFKMWSKTRNRPKENEWLRLRANERLGNMVWCLFVWVIVALLSHERFYWLFKQLNKLNISFRLMQSMFRTLGKINPRCCTFSFSRKERGVEQPTKSQLKPWLI